VLWNLRALESSCFGIFVLWNLRALESSCFGIFVLWNLRALESHNFPFGMRFFASTNFSSDFFAPIFGENISAAQEKILKYFLKLTIFYC
jgi:hypothetical protein